MSPKDALLLFSHVFLMTDDAERLSCSYWSFANFLGDMSIKSSASVLIGPFVSLLSLFPFLEVADEERTSRISPSGSALGALR